MRTTSGLLIVALALAGGCGSDDGPVTLTLPANQSLLIAVQDGDGPWQQLTPDGDGNVTFEVASGRYGYAYVCQAYAMIRFVTPDLTDPATACRLSTATAYHVSGTTAPNARVITGRDEVVADAAGAYSAVIAEGSRDVVAVLDGANPRILVRHGVTVTGDTTLDLPVATEGVAMPLQTPTVTGAGTDAVSIYADLNTAGGVYVALASDPTTVPVAPAAALGPGDGAAIGVTASGPGGTRLAQRAVGDTAPTLVLPDSVAAQVDRSAARWQGDWEFTGISVRTPFSPGTETVSVGYGATGAWIAATGAGTVLPLVDPITLPGWTAGMPELPVGAQLNWYLWANRGDYDGDYDISSDSGTLTW